MTIESEYEAAARELLVEHLRSDGLRPKVSNHGVATDIGKITIDFRVEGIYASGDQMQMVFWAVVGGVRGVEPSSFELDLIGRGDDAHAALTEGVHVLVDSVIPILRADHDRRSLPGGVKAMPVTSMTDGVPAAWDLFTARVSEARCGGARLAWVGGGRQGQFSPVVAPKVRCVGLPPVSGPRLNGRSGSSG